MYAANNDASAYLHLYGGNDDTLPVLGTLNNINPVTATFGWGFFNRSTDGNLQLSRKASSTTWSQVVTFERATGNVGIGTAIPGATAHVLSPVAAAAIIASTATTTYFDIRTSTSTSIGYVGSGGMVVGAAANDLALRAITGNVVMAGPGGTLRATVGSTSLDISSVSGYGLKLPATPGNADTQTLDCYQEGTWAPTLAGFGGTNPTVTASYTRVGRLVTITVRMVATGGAQYSGTSPTTTLSLPATITPAANTTASSIMVYGDTTTVGTVTAWNDGFIYLPTFALTTQQTAFSITYRV
jgi:hypothetical protein